MHPVNSSDVLFSRRRSGYTTTYYEESIPLRKTLNGTVEERSRQMVNKSSKTSSGGSVATTPYQQDKGDGESELIKGEMWNQRYELVSLLGKGTFGQVVKAFDHAGKEFVAVKIIKNSKAFYEQAKIELNLLKHMQRNGSRDHHIVTLKDDFMFRNHLCIVFELLSFNLYDLLKNSQFKGASLNLVRKFAIQLLSALSFLYRPENQIIHCDLKPENIVLCSPNRSKIKLIDFGSSCRLNQQLYRYIQSRYYRAPEVILGRSYDAGIDMWSLGCILVEMHTGEPLFAGESERDQMMKIMEIMGFYPSHLIKNDYERRSSCVDNRCQAAIMLVSECRRHGFHIPSQHRLDAVIGTYTGGPGGRRLNEEGHDPRTYELFVDLIARMLEYDPSIRIKPSAAMHHPFFLKCGTNSSTRFSNAQFIHNQFDQRVHRLPQTAYRDSIATHRPFSMDTEPITSHGPLLQVQPNTEQLGDVWPSQAFPTPGLNVGPFSTQFLITASEGRPSLHSLSVRNQPVYNNSDYSALMNPRWSYRGSEQSRDGRPEWPNR